MAFILTVDGLQIPFVDPHDLDDLQKAVGGNIEYVPLPKTSPFLFMYCNEEGKLKGLQPNWFATALIDFPDTIVGDVVIMEKDDEEE